VPARADLLFRLHRAATRRVRVPAGTQVSTERRDDEAPIVFLTDSELLVTRPPWSPASPTPATGTPTTGRSCAARPRPCSCSRPCSRRGVYFGLQESAAGNLLRLDVTTGPEGAGVDPRRPPRVVGGVGRAHLEDVRILDDTSAGFNSTGEVTLLLPCGTRRSRSAPAGRTGCAAG
jgi:hypothetical protein